MQDEARQKQAKGRAEGNGALFCVCFVVLVGKENCHMIQFALHGFALFWGREMSHVTDCFALFVGEGSCHTLRFALFCFALVCFVLLVRGEDCHM